MTHISTIGDLYRRNEDEKLFQLIDIKNTFHVHWHEGPTNDTIYTFIEVYEKDKPLEYENKIEILDYTIYKFTLEKNRNDSYVIDIEENQESVNNDVRQDIVLESKESVMKELEEKGEKAVLEIVKSKLSVSDAQDCLLTIMKNSIDECEKRTGTKMTYSEMRMMFG